MRIAIVVPGGVGADGIHEVIPALLSLVARLAVRHEVVVIATDQVASPPAYELGGARILALGRHGRGPIGRLRLARRLWTSLRDFRPDLIHAIWLGPGTTLATLAGWRLGRPVVASIGGGELISLPRIRYGGARSWPGRWQARFALRRAAAVTAGSRSALAPVGSVRVDGRWLPLGAERIEEANLKVRTRSPDDPIRLIVVASVNRVKGPEVVVGALARALPALDRQAHLEWIGEDTLRASSAALATALGLGEAVTFRGFRPHHQVLAALGRADIFIQGSHHESQGVAVLEAAMAGVPTVGTSVGLVAELAALDPPAAVAVPVGNPVALADAIVELALDDVRRGQLGGAAREWALDHDADWTAASFEALYAGVTARR
jgi:glycosyltransferase involved in cell wall biosynthesis